MSCISVTLSREGGVTATAERIGGFISTLTRAAGATARLEREGAFSATITRKNGMSCRLWQVCPASIRKPFLEISPEVVWILAGYTQNDVYSNTTWNIEQ